MKQTCHSCPGLEIWFRSAASVVCVFILAFAVQSLTVTVPAAAADDSTAALNAAIGSPIRSAQDKARDRYRHPLETLTFFGTKPDMTVVEIWPGAGWYTEIL